LSDSADFTQTLATSNSISLSKTSSSDIIVPGPKDLASGASAGIDHDFDVILLWINPVANLVVSGPNSALWTGYHFDPADPVNEMDVVPVYVAWLKNPSLMPAGVAFALARTWAPEPVDGSGSGLSSEDFATILQRDPFADGSPNIDPARFQLSGETFAFAPPPNGGQPFTEKMSLAYQALSQQSHTKTDTYTVSYTTTSSNSNTDTFLDNALKVAQTASAEKTRKQTLTIANTSSVKGTQDNSQKASLTLVGPSAWAVPTDLQVYQDNIYGTFMFAFVPETTFQLSLPAPSQTTTAGGNAIFTVTATVLTGVSETINLSTSGLPATVASSFSPASLAGSGSSVLTLSTSASTPPGIYPFTISGAVTTAGGNEVHVASATLIVGPAQGFLFTASPPVQTTPAGLTAAYQISTAALGGFNGTVTLGTGPLPAGVSASFNPATITGSGSSTLTISTNSSTTPVGSYALTITGSSGTLPQASTAISLFVYSPFGTTGTGCSVGFTLNPPAPSATQPLTITATLQGLASGNTGTAAISLDHQQLCAATSASPCSTTVNAPTQGTHEFEWSCSSSGPGGPGTGNGNFLFGTDATADGSVNPKYVVLTVIYTPPGKTSTVDYGSSTALGTSSSMTQAFKQGTNLELTSLEEPVNGVKIIHGLGGSFTQSLEDTESININKTSAFDIQVPGLANPTDGIDHDFDVILLWINPVVNLKIIDNADAQIPGYAFDESDPANEVDVVPVYVTWLKHPETMPDGVKNELARTWDPLQSDRSSPSLTTDDFTNILRPTRSPIRPMS
jgi:hypothetical protein